MSAFTKAMRFIGDLDDEFYADERQRDVWNEASAVGFQLFYWVGLISAAILPWVAGREGAWIAVGIVVASSLISYATLAYSAARGVNMHAVAKIGRLRAAVVVVVLLVVFVGVAVRLESDTYSEVGSWVGALAGAIVGVGAVAAAIWLMRRRRDRFENGEI